MNVFHFIFLSVFLIWAADGAPGPRILGGTEAEEGRFKSSAGVYITTAKGLRFCSGTLVGRMHVLTSAQCIKDGILWTIHLGSSQLGVDDETALTLVTDFAIPYNLYNEDTLEHNVGLIKFRKLINFTETIQPLGYNSNDVDISKSVTQFGWGQTTAGTTSLAERLTFVELQAITNEECRETFGDFLLAGMLCAVGPNYEGFCTGDSGSPLVQKLPNGEEVVVGIASFLSSNGCESSDPAGYTRTHTYQGWIQAIIQNV